MAAEWMVQFIESGVGPGGWKLIDEDEPILLSSPASALREIRLPDGAAGFYKTLATDVQAEVGDGASFATYLAAHLVRSGAKGHLDGIPLAKRQILAWLDANAKPHEWQNLPDLQELSRKGTIALDDVDICVDKPGWHLGLRVTPSWGPKTAGTGNVLILQNWKRGLATDAVARGNFFVAEQAAESALVARVIELGVGLLICQAKIPESAATRLHNLGVHVVENGSLSSIRRLERATNATVVPSLSFATATEVGVADWHWDDDLIVEGPGPAATFGVLAENAWAGIMAKDQAERDLRKAGALMLDARALQAGWREALVANLRSIADHAPGHAPLGIIAVADAITAFSSAVTRNHGADPLDGQLSEIDAVAVIRLAVGAGLDTAVQILRIDARHDKRGSSGSDLRGGGTKIGSPKGMPGDVPPLM